jgi:tRNA-2-methylthio-N6-dimethylallyladenosine synthase
MNARDSEAISALLIQHGFLPAESEEEADVIVVNTCSVRGKAEDKAVGKLRMLLAARHSRSSQIIGAVGCMIQRMGREILQAVPQLDFAIGTHRLAFLPDVIELVAQGRGPIVDVAEDSGKGKSLSTHLPGQVSTFVNILYGCDRHCTYCIVPTVRGSEWSRPADEVVHEVQQLIATGVREVTLLGQSVMSYGRKNPVWPDHFTSPLGLVEPFPRLLEAVAGVEGLQRIRFTSGHPSGCTAELVRAMAELPTVCEHLHIPMQSGSDRILGLMNRGYTAATYRRATAALKTAMPDIAITTDVIVGFPGETVEEFEMTRALMNEIGFDNAFIFKYSARPETPAAALNDDVSFTEKMRRNKVLLEDQDVRGQRINDTWIGRNVEVLVEGGSRRNAARWSGRTRANKIAIFERTRPVNIGAIATLRIERAAAQTLYGTLI